MPAKQTLENFLLEYSRLETLLKKSETLPDTVLEYEATVDAELSEKIKLCRIIRNYCRHHADYASFVDVSKGMYVFLKNLNDDIEKQILHVYDKTKKVGPLTTKDSLRTAVDMFVKTKVDFVPVINKAKTGEEELVLVMSRKMLLAMISENPSLAAKIEKVMLPKIVKMQPSYVIADYNDLLERYNATQNLVVYKDDKYKGIVMW